VKFTEEQWLKLNAIIERESVKRSRDEIRNTKYYSDTWDRLAGLPDDTPLDMYFKIAEREPHNSYKRERRKRITYIPFSRFDRENEEGEIYNLIEKHLEFSFDMILACRKYRLDETLDCLLGDLGDIPPKHQIVLKALSHGKTQTETADEAGVTVRTVRNIKNRYRER
jgi:DNA-directed RNA polymerase specialized sigma24 family protein